MWWRGSDAGTGRRPRGAPARVVTYRRFARVHLHRLGDGPRLLGELLERQLQLPRVDALRLLPEEPLTQDIELAAQPVPTTIAKEEQVARQLVRLEALAHQRRQAIDGSGVDRLDPVAREIRTTGDSVSTRAQGRHQRPQPGPLACAGLMARVPIWAYRLTGQIADNWSGRLKCPSSLGSPVMPA